jgi:hypothetical protein
LAPTSALPTFGPTALPTAPPTAAPVTAPPSAAASLPPTRNPATGLRRALLQLDHPEEKPEEDVENKEEEEEVEDEPYFEGSAGAVATLARLAAAAATADARTGTAPPSRLAPRRRLQWAAGTWLQRLRPARSLPFPRPASLFGALGLSTATFGGTASSRGARGSARLPSDAAAPVEAQGTNFASVSVNYTISFIIQESRLSDPTMALNYVYQLFNVTINGPGRPFDAQVEHTPPVPCPSPLSLPITPLTRTFR